MRLIPILATGLVPACLLLTSSCGGGGGGDSGSGAFVNTVAMTIPNVGQASVYPSVIAVSGLKHNVTSVSLTLVGLSHQWPDDLDVLLVSPSGQSSMVMSDVGGATAAVGINLTVFGGGGPLPDAGGLLAGSFGPTNSGAGDTFPVGPPGGIGPYSTDFSVFNGTNPNGAWLLFVVDDAAGQAGSLNGWTLSLTAN